MRSLIVGNILQNKSLARDYSEAEAFLTRIGLKPININETIGTTADLNSLVALHLDQLKNCDAVFMLQGWVKCPCARIVNLLAVENNKRTIYENLIAGDKILLLKAAIRSVENCFGLTFPEIVKEGRKREYYFARLILVHYMDKICVLEEAEIASIIGRDETTVKYYFRKFPYEMKFNREFRDLFEKAEINLSKSYYTNTLTD